MKTPTKLKRLLKSEFMALFMRAHKTASKEIAESNWQYYKSRDRVMHTKAPDKRVRCCKHARVNFCVCVASSYCPVHGSVCCGSHD